MSYWGYPAYESVAKKRAKATKKLKQLKKKNPNIKPVVIEGKALANTWWGKAWNKNLEKYADFSNRIGRGRSYVRHGSVLDLQIESNKITSQVMGSGSSVYKIVIEIKEINKATWMKIRQKCEGSLDSLQKLLSGKFPKALQEIFTAKGEGLFPSPKEISFACSCPDSASMCKHIAATLYGIGVRLDEDPKLYFALRNAKIKDLISQAVSSKTSKLLKQSQKKTKKVMEDADLSNLFGIDLEENPKVKKVPVPKLKNKTKKVQLSSKTAEADQKQPKSVKKNKKVPAISKLLKAVKNAKIEQDVKRSPTKKKITTKVVKASAVKKKLTTKKQPELKSVKKKNQSPIEMVKDVILKSKNGITPLEIEQQTGIPKKQIYPLVGTLKEKQIIKNKKRGVYIKYRAN